MRDLSELNINVGGKPVRRRAPTRDDIESFQKHFGIRLPEDYLDLLRFSNGGCPELDCIDPVGRPGAERIAVNHFCYLDDDERWVDWSLWQATEEWRPVLGKNSFPFARTGCGDPIFLDLRTSPPSVKRCIHDDCFAIVGIAPSFEVFIDGLFADPDMI